MILQQVSNILNAAKLNIYQKANKWRELHPLAEADAWHTLALPIIYKSG